MDPGAFKQNNEKIEHWFKEHMKFFSETNSRIDYYLSLTSKSDLSIKMREGNLEIKNRYGTLAITNKINNISGNFEKWRKEIFELKYNTELVDNIINNKIYNWVKVDKKRIGVKITKILSPIYILTGNATIKMFILGIILATNPSKTSVMTNTEKIGKAIPNPTKNI